jgi:hypothetical protein
LQEVSANVDAAAEKTEKVKEQASPPVQDLFVEKDVKNDKETGSLNKSLHEKLNTLEKQLEDKDTEINNLKTVVTPSQSLTIEKEEKRKKDFYWPMDMNGSK